jgi:RNA polymerase sigma-70 factor (ECF subfamily)
MSATRPLPDKEAAGTTTLGSLLYGDGSKSRISEGAWVALVAAMASRDVRALHTLYEYLHGFVFTIALRIANDRATADEITVDVFHEAWRRAERYNPVDGTVVGWVMNLARSRAIDRLRFENRRKRVPPSALSSEPPGDAPGAPDAIERRESSTRVKMALVELSNEERTAIELAYLSDSTYAEVARRLGVPLGTIKSRIRSGLTKLRFALAREGDR